jgi:hypothetical protein
MAPVSIVSGILLTILGLWAYFTGAPEPPKDTVSPTALIPAVVGVLLILLGLLAFNEKLRKHAMHAAAVLGLLGVLGGLGMIVYLTLIKDPPVSNFSFSEPGWLGTKKLLVNGLFALISGVFLVMCVRSFIKARIAQRKKAQEAVSP